MPGKPPGAGEDNRLGGRNDRGESGEAEKGVREPYEVTLSGYGSLVGTVEMRPDLLDDGVEASRLPVSDRHEIVFGLLDRWPPSALEIPVVELVQPGEICFEAPLYRSRGYVPRRPVIDDGHEISARVHDDPQRPGHVEDGLLGQGRIEQCGSESPECRSLTHLQGGLGPRSIQVALARPVHQVGRVSLSVP